MNPIAVIIVMAVLGRFALHVAADILNLNYLKPSLPQGFEDVFDAKRYADAQAYLRVNTRFSWGVEVADLILFFSVWFGKGFLALDHGVRSLTRSPILCGLMFIGVIVLAKSILMLPFSIYSTFVIEARFGFNKTTGKLFIMDVIKKWGLSLGIGGALISAVLAFFEYAGSWAWVYCWGLATTFIIIMQMAAPTWILPMFNQFTPLAPGELRSAIMAYAASIGFPLENVYVMDGSKRSSKSNAFFIGFGKHKRIVLYDTLVNAHPTDELLAILAHEMGHYQKRHIFWMMAAGICQTGIMLYLLSFFISSPLLMDAFYMDTPSVYAGIVFFGFLYVPIDFFLGLIFFALSRKNEYAADRFAVETTRSPRSFVNALKKLAAHNMSNLTPHPFYVFLNDSHPPVLQRIRAIEGMGGD